MKKFYVLLVALMSFGVAKAQSSFVFDPSIAPDYTSSVVLLPPSPFKTQILFVGGVDMVQTTATYGNAATAVPAKEWHDFIGFTADTTNSGDLGWIIVNHEMQQTHDNIGDGGGMTVFKVRRDANTDTLMIVSQTLADGRTGDFFNVDFANFVGETGMNCSGISSPDGRIWTAEEWAVKSNAAIGGWMRDTSDFTISSDLMVADGETIKKYQNLNWMVEVDPREAKAIRKQYNWGRNYNEGGTILPDNKTVFLGEDNTPGVLTKFVADVAGDFNSGTTYVYKHDAPTKWIEIDNGDFDKMLNFHDEGIANGATMFNRLEWVTYDPHTDAVYITETGRDNPGSRLDNGSQAGGVYAPHHLQRALEQGGKTPNDPAYWDYYGRVLKLDLATDDVSIFLEAGPYFAADSVNSSVYPQTHLSNPDGLTTAQINGKSFMIIQEDLNGSSHGRVPSDIATGRTCELFMLDMAITNPTLDDLIRIAVVPTGAEVTGAKMTSDGKTLLVNAQHPSSSNPYPYNHSFTFAITGWDQAVVTNTRQIFDTKEDFSIFPNPTTRELHFKKVTDVAIYNAQGQRVMVARNTDFVDVGHLPSGTYFVRNANGITKQLVIQK
jgi:hypothetical protein